LRQPRCHGLPQRATTEARGKNRGTHPPDHWRRSSRRRGLPPPIVRG
jgi:hypothetical protein